MQKRLLISGFPPFGGHQENPSAIMTDIFAAKADSTLACTIVECNWQRAFPQLKSSILEHEPELIISLGLSAAAEKITIETAFYNENNSIEDNAGALPESAFIRADGPGSYFCLFSEQVYEQLAPQIDLCKSTDAGRYLCNHLAYQTRYYLDDAKLPGQSMFIHLPEFHRLSNDRETAVNTMANALALIIEAAREKLSQ